MAERPEDRNVKPEVPDSESLFTTPITAERDPEKRLGKSMLMKAALASVVIASLIISITCVMQANQLRARTDELQAEIDDYKEKISRLQYYLNQPVDDEYIIEYAREYLDMYFPDEDVYYNDVNE